MFRSKWAYLPILISVFLSAAQNSIAGDPLDQNQIVRCVHRLVRESSPKWLRSPRILFVGDFKLVQAQLLDTLRVAGMAAEVGWVSTAEELDRSLSQKWSVIVAVRSPDSVSPEEALRALKLRHRRIPLILVVDSYDQHQSIESATRAGAVDFVTRYNFQRLALSIVHELRAAHTRRRWHRLRNRTQQAEDHLSLLFSQSRDLLYLGSADGKAVSVNPAYLSVLGFTAQEIYAQNLNELVHPDDFRHLEVNMAPLLAGEASVPPFEIRMRCKSGSYRTIAWSIVVPKKLGVVLGIGRDVTEIKQRQLADQHENKMRALGQLAAGVAHDFNNLLQIILGYTEMLPSVQPLNEQGQLMMGQINDASARAVELILRISKFGRKEPYNPKPTSLSELVAETVKLLSSTYPKNIELITKQISPQSEVLIDGPQLVQVLINFANNARDAMKKTGADNRGRITFTVSEKYSNGSFSSVDGLIPAGNYMAIEIADNGTGIDPAIVDRLFEPYFTTKQAGDGTGLGLAIAHRLIRDHKGFVSVSSQLGLGTTFTLYFPSLPGRSIVQTPPPASNGKKFRNGNGKRVLIVDDEPAIRTLHRLMFEPENYMVTVAADGAAAWSLISASPANFDIVITDFSMPNLNGLELTKKIRKDGITVPILLLTGQQQVISEAEVLATGVSKILGKPSSKPIMIKTVEELLDAAEEAD